MPNKDPAKRKAIDDAYKKAHRQEYIDQATAWNKANREKVSARNLANRLANPEKYRWIECKKRAKKIGLDFDLEVSDIVIPTHCPILGIPLFSHGGFRTDNSPSVDRIDNTKGYVKGNVWIISWRANRLKADASLTELKKIVEVWSQVLESNQVE